MSQRSFTAEEAYQFLASESESSDGATLFYLSSSSSSHDEDDDEGPPRRHSRPTALETPERSDSTIQSPEESCPIWTSVPENYVPQIPKYTGTPGIKFDTAVREFDFFNFFFSEDLIELMVVQTNLFAEQYKTKNPGAFLSQPHRWTPVTVNEMYIFWGLLLNMGLVKKPSLRDYWSTDILYYTPLYRTRMSRMRYEAILRFLRYADNEQCPPRDDPSFDRLYKLRPIVDHVSARFVQAYTPEKYISIDESLVHFKGRLKFRQYLPSKRARYGVKMYKLCESASGYTYRFRIYQGKDTKIDPPECPSFLRVSAKIVWDLLHPLLDQGYHLYLDNFYTSVALFNSLASRNTAVCGTVRKNQRGLPKTLLGQTLRRGESRAQCTSNVLYVKYKDKREVLVLTTIHGHTSTHVPERGTSTETPKPDCILDYNRYMGGVDLSDQVLKPYSAMRKSRVWYKKLAVHIVQMAMYNAYVLFRCAGQRGTFLDFQEVVIKNILFRDQEGTVPSTSGSEAPCIVPGQHFPGEVPQTSKKGKNQKRCRVCAKRGIRKDTIYQCDTCPEKPGLCMKECFRIYHTSLDIFFFFFLCRL
ncbi:LOW QUALITY PROTEIN: piggyBac transposable element-derived protein 4-like [Leptodactylus fuscus]